MSPGWIRRIVTMLVMAAAPPAGADEFSDFRIPAHRVTDWTAGVNAAVSRASSAYPGQDDRFRSADGGVRSNFRWLADSDPTLTSASFEVVAFGAGQWESRDLSSSLGRSSSAAENRRANERWRASLAHRRYPWTAPLGFSISATGIGQYQQAWQHADDYALMDDGLNLNEDVSRTRSEQWDYRHLTFLDVMAGWGRTRDATGVYEALILEERLARARAITQPLSAEARRRLAALMVVRSEFSRVRERPAKDLWREVERILRADGALGEGGVDAGAALRAAEVHLGRGITDDGLPSSPVPRFVGLFVGPWLSLRSTQSILRADVGSFSQRTVNGIPDTPIANEFHFRGRTSFDEVLGGVSAEVHRPLGPRWQLDASGRVAAQLRSQDGGFDAAVGGSASWMVSDRWVASAFGSYSRRVNQEAGGGPTREDYWTTLVATRVTWFIEDRLQLDVNLQEQQFEGARAPFSQDQRFGTITVGLTYRLLGTFRAPDLELGGGLP